MSRQLPTWIASVGALTIAASAPAHADRIVPPLIVLADMMSMPAQGGAAPAAMPGGMMDDKMGKPAAAMPGGMADDKMGPPAMSPPAAAPPAGMPGSGGMAMMPPAMSSMMSTMMGQMAKMQPPPAAPLDHVEGRIAFIKAELRITDAQAAPWDQFAQALRASRGHLDEARQALVASQDGQSGSPARLDAYERHLTMRLGSLHEARESYQRLYATLNPTQKQSADEMVSPLLASF